MPGASEHTRRVKVLSANWTPSPDGGDGLFELLVITEDDQRYTMATSPASMTALVALSRADTVLTFDTSSGILTAANIAGQAPRTARSHEPANGALTGLTNGHAPVLGEPQPAIA
jgi:hypothetical protein